MTDGPMTNDEERRLQARRRARRDEAMVRLPPPTLVALAGAPFWTPATMRAAGMDFQEVSEAARALLRRDGHGDDVTICLEDDVLSEVVLHLQETPPSLPDTADMFARATLVKLGNDVAGATEKPPVLVRWARLAATLRDGTGPAADQLLDDVRRHCQRGELGEATQLLEAAAPLARVLGGQLAAAERVGRHRVEREFRLARDRQHLTFFVDRGDATVAFEQLLAEDGPWALHYIGVGGAGKTTFIRHLAVDEAARRGLNVACIDFDYLSPAYPGRDPGQLIQAIVHELTVQIDRIEQDRWLLSIHEQLERLRLVAREAHETSAVGPIAWPEFQELLSSVGSFLASLQRPVIIFDTCEELMKLTAVGGKIPSVEATLHLAAQLHEYVPAIRFMFAGRRILTRGGAGWTASSDALTQALSDARPWLALHELRGMTAGQASGVFEQLLPVERRRDAPLRRTLLAKSPEDGRVNGIARIADDPTDVRYSPFRIVRYARWVSAEPTLSTDQLEQGADPYIEQRIIQRMGALEPLLASVVLLRRFDARTFAAVQDQPVAAAAQTLRELAGHEWIYAIDDAERGLIIQAKSTIRDQLEAYLRAHRPCVWQDAARSIEAALVPRLAEPNQVLLPPELVDAALRAMPGVTAVRAWYAVERSIGSDWSSALALTRFLLGEDNAAGNEQTLLGAAVRATYLSALIHEQPEVDVAPQWRKIVDVTNALEQIGSVRMLNARARLGAIAAAGWAGTVSARELATELSSVLVRIGRPPPVAATWIIAAVEGLIERLERDFVGYPELLQLATGAWWESSCSGISNALDAYIAVLRARAYELLHEPSQRRQALHLAVALVATSSELPATCLDWLPPAGLQARIRLEALRLQAYEAGFDADAMQWLPSVQGDELDDDEDHLLATIVGCLGSITTPPIKIPLVRRRCWGVRQPTAFRRSGSAACAAELVRWDAQDFVYDIDPVEKLRVSCTRARRTRNAELLATGVISDTAGRMFVETAQAAAIVVGRSEAMPAALAATHDVVAHWSYQRAITSAELHAAVAAMRPYVQLLAESAGARTVAAMRANDALAEVVALSCFTTEPIAVAVRVPRSSEAHADELEDVLRVSLRVAAARDVPPEIPEALDRSSAAVRRLIARLALEEAELLSLRFPDLSVRLFDLATSSYADLDDHALAEAAAIAGLACRRVLGNPPVAPPEPTTEALCSFARRVGDPAAPFPHVERGDPRRASLWRRARAWLRRYSDIPITILGISLGIGIIVALWWVVDRLFLPIIRRAVPIPDAWWLSVILLVLIMVALGSTKQPVTARPLWRWLRARWPWRYRPGLTLRPGRDGQAIGTVQLPYRVAEVPLPVPQIGLLPSWEAAEAILLPFHADIRKSAPQTVLARIEVASALCNHAWEANLVAPTENLVTWRSIARPWTPPFSGTIVRGLHGVASTTSTMPTYVEREIASAWLHGCAVTSLERIQGIAHLVGRPRRRVGGVDLERALPASAATPVQMSRRYDNLDVVLQLAPQEQDQASTATRTEMGLLRELATTLVERGAHSVIVLPAMARGEVEGLVTALARIMGTAPERELARLAEALRACRRRLAEITHGDHVVVANEVTLLFGVDAVSQTP